MRRVSVALIGVVLTALVDRASVPMLHDVPTARAAEVGAADEPSGTGVPTVGAPTGSGVATGNVVQIPVQVFSPIQACNNNVAGGLIAVSVDALNSTTCGQDDGG